MKILFVASYYCPYTSGLTIHAQRIAEGLVRRKHQLTVLTNQHQSGLTSQENINGVQVVRHKPLFRLSRGFVSPWLLFAFLQRVLKTDTVGLHLPLPEAFIFATLAKFLKKRVILIYHANLNLPSWLITSPIFEAVVFANHFIAGIFADRIVAYSQDYASYSNFLRLFKKKIKCIYPPVLLSKPERKKVEALRKKWSPCSERIIGFAGRFAEEKGGDILIRALPKISAKIPKFKLVFAGEYENLVYEDFYQRQKELIDKNKNYLLFLGPVPHEKMANFYAALDVLALPSRAECFGGVQVEAMLSGCPVVAFDIPGGRVPIKTTGMGKLAGQISSKNLAQALIEVLENKNQYLKPKKKIEGIFNFQKTIDDYEELFSV